MLSLATVVHDFGASLHTGWLFSTFENPSVPRRRGNDGSHLWEKELTDVGRERALRCTASLSSLFVSLPASCLLLTCSPGPVPGLRGELLYEASSASAGLHQGERLCTNVSNDAAKLGTGVVSAPHAQLDTASSASSYQTRQWVAPDWLLTEQAHGGVRQV